MARKFQVRTPEQHRAYMRQQEQLAASTDAAIKAFVDAIHRGESAEAAEEALLAANAKNLPQARRVPPLPEPDAMLRIRDEGWTADKQRAFLLHLANTGCVSHACAHVDLSRQSAYALRQRAPNSVFAIGWDVAIHMARQSMLDEATERAFQGREVPVWYHGEQVGTRIVHNDRLLMFLLAMKREPLHPALDAREMTHLFPAMLRLVDIILPPAFSAERIAELLGEDDLG